jgi:hypothetical protein
VPHRELASTHRTLFTSRESRLKDESGRHTNRKRKRLGPSSRSQSADEIDQEKAIYEKRARHKTREDKYEPYHGGPAHSKPVEEASGIKAVRSGLKEKGRSRRKKNARSLTTAKELMGKFQSDAIHNERLTVSTRIISLVLLRALTVWEMLPSMHVGIFNNSKHGKAPGGIT